MKVTIDVPKLKAPSEDRVPYLIKQIKSGSGACRPKANCIGVKCSDCIFMFYMARPLSNITEIEWRIHDDDS